MGKGLNEIQAGSVPSQRRMQRERWSEKGEKTLGSSNIAEKEREREAKSRMAGSNEGTIGRGQGTRLGHRRSRSNPLELSDFPGVL